MRFSTEGIAGPRTLASWREIFGHEVMKLDMEPLGDMPFHCSASLRTLPGLIIASIAGSPNRLMPARTKEDSENFLVVVPTSGTTTVSAHGRDVSLGPGDATVISTADLDLIVTPSPASFLALAIPAMILGPVIANLGEVLTTLIPSSTDALQLLLGYVAALHDDMTLAAPGTRHQVVTHIHDLVAMALGAGSAVTAMAQGHGLRAARLRAIKSDIMGRLDQHDLSVEVLAARHRVSARYISRLFKSEGRTFTDFVLTQRLKRAHDMLQDGRFADRSVGTIAFDTGFSDLSYFNRTFRRAHGTTPSDVRKAQEQSVDRIERA
ncbi:AraC family transcriptional regulator [Mesorhizobium sp. BH1-1-4]|uniref:AraC family transcriptional regulator n=1 Tax=Mesorhizobium sp. BH1-1-4 TaxID=2876662 RepID=UPI001CD11D86|nr:AraC family transcriptional regulator [Mesorhizobium sp. BH1-1-4]MBZ9993126.1 AraC family transcriptional regulator [Mesorhizobium sp. BH1-1-4]